MDTRPTWLRVLAALLVGLFVAVPGTAAHPAGQQKSVAQVRYIYRGLTVQPPHRRAGHGKLKQNLYSRYVLRTQTRQKASLRFHDGTVLYMNQRTDAVLRSPNLTYVNRGQVDQILTPGTNHRVQTASAVATAIGTNFLVKAVKGGSYFAVVHGKLLVKNKHGQQYVSKNHETLVVNGQAPQPPIKVNAQALAAWTKGMPPANLPDNLALDSSGAKIVAVSSQYTSAVAGPLWDAKYIHDGRLDTGWESASGDVTNQWIKVSLPGTKTYRLSRILIDPSATRGDPASADLKDFEIRVSTTTADDANFRTVLTGRCAQNASLQSFTLNPSVKARYVELYALDNYGSPDWIAVAELEVVGKPG